MSQDGGVLQRADGRASTDNQTPSGANILGGLRQQYITAEQELTTKEQQRRALDQDCSRLRKVLGHLQEAIKNLEEGETTGWESTYGSYQSYCSILRPNTPT